MKRVIIFILLGILSTIYSQTPTLSGNSVADFGLSRTSIQEWQQAGCLKQIGNIQVTQYINLADRGAVGDGNYDNTQILDNAIIDATNHNSSEEIENGFTVIYLPAGTYKITSKIQIASNMVLKGESTYNTSLLFDFREKAENGQELNVNYLNFGGKHNAGIENVYISRAIGNNYYIGSTMTETSYAKSSVYVVSMWGSENCWLKGIHSFKATSKHVLLSSCNNVEIRGCYFRDCTRSGSGGNGYGVNISGNSHHNLIEDNIFYHLRHSMILVDNAYSNVLAYNASYDPYTSQGILGSYNWCGDVTFHGYHCNAYNNGPWNNLVEGNRLGTIHFDWSDVGCCDDGQHTNGDLNNVFRNSATETGFRMDHNWDNVDGSANTNEDQNVMNNYFYCEDFIDYGPWSVDDNSPRLWALNNVTSDGIEKSENQELYNWISLYHEEKPDFLDINLPAPWDTMPTTSWPVWRNHTTQQVSNYATKRYDTMTYYTTNYPNDYLRYVNIIKQPNNQYLLPGDDAIFSIEVSGMEIENVEYQWYELRINSYEWVETSTYYGGNTSKVTIPNFANAYYDVNPCEFRKFKCEIKSPSTKPFFTDEISAIVFAKDAVNYRHEYIGNGDIRSWGSAETMTLDNVCVYGGGTLNLSTTNSILLKPGFIIHEKGYLSAKLDFVLPNDSKYLPYTIIPIEQLKGIVDPVTGAKL